MFTMTVFLLQRGLLDQLVASAPPNMPNVFLINITSREQAGIEALLKAHQQSIQGEPEVLATTPAKLETVDGTPVRDLVLEARRRRYDQPRAVTVADAPRAATDVTSGQWWPATGSAKNQVCVFDGIANELHIQPGAKLAFSAGLGMIDATAACVFRNEEVQMGTNFEFVFSPGSLDGLPMQYFALARMKPTGVARFQKDAFKQFPSVTVINGADVLGIVQDVVDQIALVVRFISAFAILAGIIILASSVASTRFRRVREVAVLKTLGAKKARIAGIFSIEFLILGGLAGLVGGLLATGFSQVVLVNLLEARFQFDWLANLTAVALSAIIANIAGWLASSRILGEKPLEVLRGE
jgi:putative ABC transport system permease protein